MIFVQFDNTTVCICHPLNKHTNWASRLSSLTLWCKQTSQSGSFYFHFMSEQGTTLSVLGGGTRCLQWGRQWRGGDAVRRVSPQHTCTSSLSHALRFTRGWWIKKCSSFIYTFYSELRHVTSVWSRHRLFIPEWKFRCSVVVMLLWCSVVVMLLWCCCDVVVMFSSCDVVVMFSSCDVQ